MEGYESLESCTKAEKAERSGVSRWNSSTYSIHECHHYFLEQTPILNASKMDGVLRVYWWSAFNVSYPAYFRGTVLWLIFTIYLAATTIFLDATSS